VGEVYWVIRGLHRKKIVISCFFLTQVDKLLNAPRKSCVSCLHYAPSSSLGKRVSRYSLYRKVSCPRLVKTFGEENMLPLLTIEPRFLGPGLCSQ
jgi:hypothetical protein